MSRHGRAVRILANNGVDPQKDGTFDVQSELDTSRFYIVAKKGVWKCDCMDYQLRAKECKHILAVKGYREVTRHHELDEICYTKALGHYCSHGVRRNLAMTDDVTEVTCERCLKYIEKIVASKL